MKVLLGECVPRKLKYDLPGHDCQTVPESGLAGKRNGELLSEVEAGGFEVFVTMDRESSLSRISPAGTSP
ncbi:MAG: hypothetical protein GY953_10915 [bacterium]|nr:hypothetical protein [bacterium]